MSVSRSTLKFASLLIVASLILSTGAMSAQLLHSLPRFRASAANGGSPDANALAAPPPPTTPTPTPLPVVPEATGQQSHTPPSPGKLSSAMEQVRAKQAMQVALDKYLQYRGPRYQVAPIEVLVDGEWARGIARWQSEVKTYSSPINILAHRLPDGTWLAAMPEKEGAYLQWLETMPASLMPESEKAQPVIQALSSASILVGSGSEPKSSESISNAEEEAKNLLYPGVQWEDSGSIPKVLAIPTCYSSVVGPAFSNQPFGGTACGSFAQNQTVILPGHGYESQPVYEKPSRGADGFLFTNTFVRRWMDSSK